MSDPARPAAQPILPRAMVEQRILDAVAGTAGAAPVRAPVPPPIQILDAPRGAGKTTLLGRLASLLAGRGFLPAFVDFEQISTSPIDVAEQLPSVLARAAAVAGAAPGRRSDQIARALAEEIERRKPDPALLLDLAMSYPQALARDLGRPLALLVDELGEAARLSRHSGLRDCLGIIARRLASSLEVALVAAVSPASRPAALLNRIEREASAAGRGLHRLAVPPLSEREMAALLAEWGLPSGDEQEVEVWMKATNGHPLYAAILARRLSGQARREDLASALAGEISGPFGSLYQECRFDYHLLVERSRGHAAVRTIVQILARDDGAHLSTIARRLRISLPTALDYLSWLLEVGLIRRDGRGYVLADPLLKLWVVLNAPEPVDPLDEVVQFLLRPRAAPLPPARPRGRRPGAALLPREPPLAAHALLPEEPPAAREEGASTESRGAPDLLIEID